MTRLLLTVSVLACLSVSCPGASAAECDNPTTVREMVECENVRLRNSEREMGEVYGRLLDSADRQFAVDIRKAQEAWMRWREAEANLAARMAHDQEMGLLARKKAEAQMTEDRIRDLRNYED